jgi:hypothetical protein
VWIGQILLFFLVWRLFHWLTGKVCSERVLYSLVTQGIINLVIAIVFLIVFYNLHSAWWLMATVAAGIGILTGQAARRE